MRKEGDEKGKRREKDISFLEALGRLWFGHDEDAIRHGGYLERLNFEHDDFFADPLGAGAFDRKHIFDHRDTIAKPWSLIMELANRS